MMAEGTARRAAAAARGAAGDGEERFLALARGDMEGLMRANQALVDSTSELGRAWLVCWQEQFAEGMALTREVLERQGTFVRSSLERLSAQAARSAEVTSGMADGYFAPLRESRAAERATRPPA
jgi:Phasin protein